MSTTAVTTAAPAAAPAAAAPKAAPIVETSERLAEFLPEGKHYRLTGEMPGAKDDEQKPTKKTPAAGAEDSSAADGDANEPSQSAEIDAAPDAAQAQRTKKGAAARLQEVLAERKRDRDRIQELERQLITPNRETAQASQPATETRAATPKSTPKPKIDDVDTKTGQPKYKSYAEFEDAKDSWLLEEGARKAQETNAKTQREQHQSQVQNAIAQEWGKRTVAAAAKHADFNTVALNPNLPIKQGSIVDVFVLDSDHGTDVLYHLGKNPAELDRIQKLNPIQQARELVKIELKVAGSGASSHSEDDGADAAEKPSSAKPVTQAPPPPHQVSGKGTVTKEAVAQAVEDGDSETYIREQNNRDLARRRKGK